MAGGRAGGLCLVTATSSGVMPILLRSSPRTAELCRYYYEARDAQRSYADNTTKLATHSGVTGDHVIWWRDVAWSSRLRGLRSKYKGFRYFVLFALISRRFCQGKVTSYDAL